MKRRGSGELPIIVPCIHFGIREYPSKNSCMIFAFLCIVRLLADPLQVPILEVFVDQSEAVRNEALVFPAHRRIVENFAVNNGRRDVIHRMG